MKKQKSALDYTKFILSILIVILHTGGGGYFSTYFIQTVCRLAVPLFLTISGYLLYSKLDDTYKWAHYILRICGLYLVYTVVYIPFGLKLQCYTLNWRSIIYAFVHATFIQLWYFPALIFATLVLVVTYKLTHKLYPILVVGLLFHVWGILSYTYGLVPSLYEIYPWSIQLVDNSPNNFLYVGLFYVTLGAFIRSRDGKISNIVQYIILCISTIFWLLEARYFLNGGGCSSNMFWDNFSCGYCI